MRLFSLIFVALCCFPSLGWANDAVKLAESLEKWEAAKAKCGGNYSYTVMRSSFTGAGHTTLVVVKANKVAERSFTEFGARLTVPLPPGAVPAPPKPKWVETGAEIGKHADGSAPAKTLDELYAEAQKVLDAKLDPDQKRYLYFNDQGLIKSCFYVDTRIADDAPIVGVTVDNIKLAVPK